jgi:aminomethyltransferase
MGHHTPLFDAHVNAGARMVDFGGWEMPLHYGSQIEEHHAVRSAAGVFDVSHMTIVDVAGDGAQPYLRYLLANDVTRLRNEGDALYTVMLNADGGVVDDLIAYRRKTNYRLVVNSATRDKVTAWMQAQAKEFSVTLVQRADLAMLAVQGPQAVARYVAVTKQQPVSGLRGFTATEIDGWMVSRTGYTGEDGVEVMLPAVDVELLWTRLLDAGVPPAGLGARDTLRLEAGMNLYGQDMDETTTPLEARIGWTVAWEPAERQFLGRRALERHRASGAARKLVGLVLDARGVLRHGQVVHTAAGDGVVTSGIFSPTLGYSIALARVPGTAKGACEVDIRGKRQPARIVRPPFVRNGEKIFEQAAPTQRSG